MSARHLLNNAKNGNFEAAVQVFLNYRDGAQDFEKSEELATLAFDNVIKILESNFYLDELVVLNFRRIIELNINLHKNLTVFIGENGAGKTTLLHAIQKNLSWLSATILKENTNGERIVDAEINNQAKQEGKSSFLACNFRIGTECRLDGHLVREPLGIITDLKTGVTEYRKFGRNIRELIAFGKVDLPLFMFYDINRFKENQYKKDINISEGLFYQLDAYEKSSKSKISFEILIEWLIQLLKLSNSLVVSEDQKKLQSKINSLIDIGADDKNHPLYEFFENLVSSSKLYPVQEINTKAKRSVEVVELLFKKIYPNLIKIQLVNDDDGKDKIALQLGSEIIFLHQFSDGQRVLFGLIGDIARRLIQLNDTSNSPLEGRGIVLIDEIELHLHPNWQQKIILILRDSFPNVQFIMTTHSPHVLSTVDKAEIRVIKDNLVEKPNFQTKGVMSSTILNQIMDAYSVPEVQESKWITEYLSLIQIGDHESNRGVVLFQKLVDHFGEDHPQLSICRQQKKMYELKKLANRNSNEKAK